MKTPTPIFKYLLSQPVAITIGVKTIVRSPIALDGKYKSGWITWVAYREVNSVSTDAVLR